MGVMWVLVVGMNLYVWESSMIAIPCAASGSSYWERLTLFAVVLEFWWLRCSLMKLVLCIPVTFHWWPTSVTFQTCEEHRNQIPYLNTCCLSSICEMRICKTVEALCVARLFSTVSRGAGFCWWEAILLLNSDWMMKLRDACWHLE